MNKYERLCKILQLLNELADNIDRYNSGYFDSRLYYTDDLINYIRKLAFEERVKLENESDD